MQFIDLTVQQKRIKDKIDANIATILEHGKYIMGPEIGMLENRLADYVGVKHAIGCASGTDALLMALLANQIGPGDAVFTSPFTFDALLLNSQINELHNFSPLSVVCFQL